MSQRDPLVPLRHMLDHAREATKMMAGKSRADLETNRMLALAISRLLEIIGEAAGRISKGEQERHPGIKWINIVSMRNRIIHGYDNINLDIMLSVVKEDFPTLIHELESIIGKK